MIKQLFLLFMLSALFSSCKEHDHSVVKSLIKPKKDIEKQQLSAVKNSTFPIKDLFGIWTIDPNGPHADFELTEKSFYIVDYDGNGDIPYEINGNKINIFYPQERVQSGLITKAQNDSLVIYWTNGEHTTYVRWTK